MPSAWLPPIVHLPTFNPGNYASFFLNGPSSVVHLETVQISHPAFSKTYWIVRNAMNGMLLTLEDGTQQFFDYYPLGLSAQGASDDLDQTLTITLGDLGTMIPQEIDRCVQANMMSTRPLVVYRVYRSDNVSAPIDGPFYYQIKPIASKKKTSTITAGAPSLNLNQTGEAYRMDRFTSMRGFL
jgi:hypothetical protein